MQPRSERAAPRWRSLLCRVQAVVSVLTGLILMAGGARLVWLGGSPYYLIAGAVVLAAGYGVWRGRLWGVWVFSLLLVATSGWALWEAGLDPWALLPRLAMLWALGLPLLMFRPAAMAAGSDAPALRRSATPLLALSLLLPVGIMLSAGVSYRNLLQSPATGAATKTMLGVGAGRDWSVVGGTAGGLRFSELDAINVANVHGLKKAWSYRFPGGDDVGVAGTPIKIGNRIFACNNVNVVVALDSTTGREIWRHDPAVDLKNVPFPVCRGVAYLDIGSGPCARRIFTNTVDARLIALDADTGARCPGFGKNGQISLLDGLGKVPKGYYYPSSAPTIGRGRIVIGGMIPDGQYWGEPSGVVRAFDARTGELSWAYDVARPDQPKLAPGEIYTPATPNSWAPMSYDDKLGLVYVPTGVATPDHFGAMRRPFDEEIGSAVMALDIQTGRRAWLFRTVHHDIWDYDVASQPVLIDFPTGRGVVPALLQATKRGETFLLDRATGKPIDAVEERPTPQKGKAPEERLSPTQPFPTHIPGLGGADLRERDMWGLTPFDQIWCRIRFREARYEGPMTPPGLTPSIMYPGYLGGMDWGGISIDPYLGRIIAPTNHVANYMQLLPRAEADAMGVRIYGSNAAGDELKTAMNIAVHAGQPYAASKAPFLSPLDVPCQEPPWSRLSAVDVVRGAVDWSHPLGSGRSNGPLGIASGLDVTMGVPAMGGALVTRGGLTFIGASTDSRLRAFDTRTGQLLWQSDLPASGNSGPMSYVAGNGRQMVVVGAGGHKLLRSKSGAHLIAYALAK